MRVLTWDYLASLNKMEFPAITLTRNHVFRVLRLTFRLFALLLHDIGCPMAASAIPRDTAGAVDAAPVGLTRGYPFANGSATSALSPEVLNQRCYKGVLDILRATGREKPELSLSPYGPKWNLVLEIMTTGRSTLRMNFKVRDAAKDWQRLDRTMAELGFESPDKEIYRERGTLRYFEHEDWLTVMRELSYNTDLAPEGLLLVQTKS